MNKKSKMNIVESMINFFCIFTFVMLLASCVFGEDTESKKNKVSEESVYSKYTDSEILESRHFIANYDERMLKVQDLTLKCTSGIPNNLKLEAIEKCSKIAYDTMGFYRSNSGLHIDEKNMYKEKYIIANNLLTSEME